jgi:hypothetical protein
LLNFRALAWTTQESPTSKQCESGESFKWYADIRGADAHNYIIWEMDMGNSRKIYSGKKKQLTTNQIESMARIINAMKPTTQEKVLFLLYRHFLKFRARSVAYNVYGVFLSSTPKKFRHSCYSEFAEGCVYGDFSGFHTMMLTECSIMDTDWTKFITKNGRVK